MCSRGEGGARVAPEAPLGLPRRALGCWDERWTSVAGASWDERGATERERERDPLVVSDQVQLASSSVLLFLVVRPGAPSSETCPETEIVSVKDES